MNKQTRGEAARVFDRWQHGDLYEDYVGRWSRKVAPAFLSWLGLNAGLRWLDVGCGTGALSAAILERSAPAAVCGVELSAGFLATARRKLAGQAALVQGGGSEIPLRDSSMDAVVSGLVLNFIPNPKAALLDMARVATHRGVVAAYVWDYAGKMEFMRYFWDAVIEMNPQAAHLDEGSRFPICRPEGLAETFARCGLCEVEVTAIDIQTRFADFADFWRPFLGGQGPGPAYVKSLAPEDRQRLETRLAEKLPVQADGSISLIARAWAARSVVAK